VNETVSETEFEEAIERVERKLGLEGQPRAIVFHEKKGRRHAHAVWSRIDADSMKAINLPFFKMRLNELSKELFLENGWSLPDGYRTNGWKNPLSFTLEDWQQAERVGLDPREIKQLFRQAWEHSDDRASFAAALREHGYHLAQGDRRGFVAVDLQGEVYSIARQTGVRTKDVEARLGNPKNLPSVDETRHDINSRLKGMVRSQLEALRTEHMEELRPLEEERIRLLEAQRGERKQLQVLQDRRRRLETLDRQARFRKGVGGILDRLNGRAAQTRRQNEHEAFLAYRRDVEQRERLFQQQMQERQENAERIMQTRRHQRRVLMSYTRSVLAFARARETRDLARNQGHELTL